MDKHERPARLTPLYVVILALGVIELLLTNLYPTLSEPWEKISVLIVILALPTAIVITFIFIWLTRPGFLFTPAEFGSDGHTPIKLEFWDSPTKSRGSKAEIQTSVADLYLRIRALEDELEVRSNNG